MSAGKMGVIFPIGKKGRKEDTGVQWRCEYSHDMLTVCMNLSKTQAKEPSSWLGICSRAVSWSLPIMG